MNRAAIGHDLKIGALAGLAGGLAEVAWIWAYAAATGSDAGLVARAVAQAVRIGGPASPIAGGVAIHMAIAAALGIAVAFALRPVRGAVNKLGLYGAVTAALAVVWAVNFFLVLPAVEPAFVEIVPLSVSFFSKLLFGVAAAWSFQMAHAVRPEPVRAR